MNTNFTVKPRSIKRKVIFCLVLLMISTSSFLLAEQEKGPAMMEGCQAMMQRHQAMKAADAEASARLQDLVDALATAEGREQSEALAAAVREIAVQLEAMRGRMMGMDSKGQMHMMMAQMKAKSGEMAECPMMQAMMVQDSGPADSEAGEALEEKKTDGHEGHH